MVYSVRMKTKVGSGLLQNPELAARSRCVAPFPQPTTRTAGNLYRYGSVAVPPCLTPAQYIEIITASPGD